MTAASRVHPDDPRDELSADAVRWTPDEGYQSAFEQCPGTCHDIGDDDCSRCGSLSFDQMCDDCRFYATQDAEVAS